MTTVRALFPRDRAVGLPVYDSRKPPDDSRFKNDRGKRRSLLSRWQGNQLLGASRIRLLRWRSISAIVSMAALVFMVRCLVLRVNRTCSPDWKTMSSEDPESTLSAALVTLADGVEGGSSARSFEGVMSMTWPNRAAYANRHGYTAIDASDLVSGDRPASWSKILAVQRHLHSYSWVLWMDADTVITNPEVLLQDFLPAATGPDFVLTKDPGGYNAGMWAMRNTEWSHKFLQRWWDMDNFIRVQRPGETKSGDNDALKHLLSILPEEEFARKVGVAPQCCFNSYWWRWSPRNVIRLISNPTSIVQGSHSRKDFILHLAGVNNKMHALRRVGIIA